MLISDYIVYVYTDLTYIAARKLFYFAETLIIQDCCSLLFFCGAFIMPLAVKANWTFKCSHCEIFLCVLPNKRFYLVKKLIYTVLYKLLTLAISKYVNL